MSKLIDIKIVPEFDRMGTGACCYHLVRMPFKRPLIFKILFVQSIISKLRNENNI